MLRDRDKVARQTARLLQSAKFRGCRTSVVRRYEHCATSQKPAASGRELCHYEVGNRPLRLARPVLFRRRAQLAAIPVVADRRFRSHQSVGNCNVEKANFGVYNCRDRPALFLRFGTQTF